MTRQTHNRWPDRKPYGKQAALLAAVACALVCPRLIAAQRPDTRADELWRAQARLERGDLVAARPVLDRLFLAELESPTEALPDVASAFLNGAVLMGDAQRAFFAWATLAAWGDDRLYADVPPLFASPAQARDAMAFIEHLERSSIARPGRERSRLLHGARVLAGLQAAASDSTTPGNRRANVSPDDPSEDPSDPAFDLLARALDPDDPVVRARARDELAEALTQRDRPETAWFPVAIGLSLLREPPRETKLRGLLALLAVDASARSDRPPATALRVLALRLAHDAAGDLGLLEVQDAIEAEFITSFPNHPGAVRAGVSVPPFPFDPDVPLSAE